MIRRRAFLALVAGLLLAACTGGGSGDGNSGGGGGSGGGAVGSPIAAPGLDAAVELVAPPTEGAGEVPTFEWKAAQGAASYRLVVLDPDGGPTWAWEGAETTVNLGGLPGERPTGEGGPVIVAGSSWSVAALDPDGHVVAVSVSRPVSP